MSQYYNVVPWFNSEEWHLVYNKLYSTTSIYSEKQEALKLLLIWKARCPSLPSGIESTLGLLEVHLEDTKPDALNPNEQVLRLAYSSAIMRFVNHMLDTETARGSSLYRAAKNLDVPDWIIDLRHDTAHSNNLPSLELLREAATIGLQWLKGTYWDKHKEHIKDYEAGEKSIEVVDNRITALMNFCLSLSICAHSKCKIKSLAQIPDDNMRESILEDVREFLSDNIDMSNMKTVSVVTLINMLNVQAKRLLKSKDTSQHVNKALLSEDSLFLSLELVELLGEKDFNKKNCLSKHFMQCFEVLLTFLHTNNLILNFILELIAMTQQEEHGKLKCKLAAVWVAEILKALKRSKDFQSRMKGSDCENENHKENKKKKDLRLLYQHWFPNDKQCGLILDLQKKPPYELTDIHFVQPIISSYNPYLTCFIKDLFKLLDPELPKGATEKIYKLAELISNPEKLLASASKVYTVDDLELETNDIAMVQNEESDCVEISGDQPSATGQQDIGPAQPNTTGIWKLASKEYSWSACPIGLLPWQQIQHLINIENNNMSVDD